MAWSFFAGTLDPGKSATWWFWWGDGRHEDQGIQVARARPLPNDAGDFKIITPAHFIVTDQGMKIELDGGYTYSITVTNLGPWACPYEIIGTGV
ncbi:MAG TPA: hypothetical protein VMS64_31255 [Candidatus Methylomirabilis sp.]|nr:hypothetical protein [Candidatus Methylomirabilis sp.]